MLSNIKTLVAKVWTIYKMAVITCWLLHIYIYWAIIYYNTELGITVQG